MPLVSGSVGIVAEPPSALPASTPIAMPASGSLEADGHGETDVGVWVEGFVIQRFPVTWRELARFLAEPEGARFRRSVLRDGPPVFRPDWPAVGLSWEGAQAYARWLSARTAQSWRLPYEIEWERAARGADGRLYPWGDVAEAAFAHLRADGRTPGRPVPVHQFPDDVSPFGVRGLAGNVRDWCADVHVAPQAVEGRTPSSTLGRRVVRGGSFRLPLESARTTSRGALPATQGYVDVGFRLVRSLAR